MLWVNLLLAKESIFNLQAVICGHDGNAWATSAGFSASPDELKNIANTFGKMDVLPMTGVKIGGEKYMFLSGDDKVLRCKKGTSGIHVMKTVQAYIIAVYHDPIVAPQVCQRELETFLNLTR